MRITRLYLAGNEHRPLRKDVVYAELRDEGGLVIAATLDYVLAQIRDRKLEVEGVKVERKASPFGGGEESYVHVTEVGCGTLSERRG